MCYQYVGAVLGNETGGIRNKIGILRTLQNSNRHVSEQQEEQHTRAVFWCVVLLGVLISNRMATPEAWAARANRFAGSGVDDSGP
jgi:hypothetical protein